MDENWHRKTTIPGIEPEEQQLDSEQTPESIGQYKIESLLEKGGMSYVYLATHPETQDPVTIKVLSPKYLSHEEVVQRFLKEAQIISLADHPNIIKLYDQGTWEEGLYIAMEFIEGMSLRQYLQNHPIPLKRALEITLEISYALCHLHTHGVIHRDLKLENVLMTKEGTVKVIDFGIAQLLTETPKGQGVARQRIIGTPIYMSPEQRANPETVSYPSDIYSLGIIAYELILGKLSHGKVHLTFVPKGLLPILSKCLKPNPEERYQDVVDLITDLSDYLNSSALITEGQKNKLKTYSDKLKQAHSVLSPHQPPNWSFADIGLIEHQTEEQKNLYYDFFDLPEQRFGVIIARSTEIGPESILYITSLRGMVRALVPSATSLVEFVKLLNERLVHDPLEHIFSLNCLVLSPKENKLHFISCKGGRIWIIEKNQEQSKAITSDNIALGVDRQATFKTTSHTWNSGDSLLLSSDHQLLKFSEKNLVKLFEQHQDSHPQQLLEIIYREICKSCENQPITFPFVMMSFK